MELAGTVALVTGASSGIGRAVALELADAGCHLVVHGRDRERVDDVAARTGGTSVVAELTDPAQREALAQKAIDTRGRVDVLISNAGVGWAGPFTGMTADHVRRVLELDLVASIDLTRLLLPDMLRRRSGALCYVTSVAGRTAVAGEAVYAAAKAGLDAFADSLRAEAHGSGVHVHVVVPGAVDTAFFEHRERPYDRSLPRPVSAQSVAAAVVRSLAEDRPEVWAPRWLRAAPAVRAVAPGLHRRLTATFGARQRLQQHDDHVRGRWP